MIKLDISTRKKQVLGYITTYIKKNDYPPSLAEMANYFGLTKTGVNYIVKKLAKDGKIEKTSEKVRNIKLK